MDVWSWILSICFALYLRNLTLTVNLFANLSTWISEIWILHGFPLREWRWLVGWDLNISFSFVFVIIWFIAYIISLFGCCKLEWDLCYLMTLKCGSVRFCSFGIVFCNYCLIIGNTLRQLLWVLSFSNFTFVLFMSFNLTLVTLRG